MCQLTTKYNRSLQPLLGKKEKFSKFSVNMPKTNDHTKTQEANTISFSFICTHYYMRYGIPGKQEIQLSVLPPKKKALCASSFVFPFLSFPNFVLKLFFFVLRTGSATSIHAEWNLLSCDQFVAHSSARARKKSIKLFTHPSPRGGPSSRVVPLKRVDRRLHNTSYCRRRGPPRWHDRRRRRNTPRSERVVTYFYDPVPPKLCLLWGCGPVAEKWFLSQWVKSALNYF